jgi:predicted aspartyl protease
LNTVRAACFLGIGLLTALFPSMKLVLAPAWASSTPNGNGCGAALANGIVLESVNDFAIVTVIANGAPLRLILDTGAEATVLNSKAAERIGGTAPRVQFERRLSGFAASLPGYEIEFKSFTIGGVDIPLRRVAVANATTPPIFLILDGILGTDVLTRFDIDLDLPNNRMSLYQKGACTPDWAGPQSEIKIGRSAMNGHLFFPAQLDNRKITATLDTGAHRTTLPAATAHAMGITDAVLAQDPPRFTRGFGGGMLASRVHRFESLTVGNVRLNNPEIIVAAGLYVRGIDLILGIDFLRSRRLWLSYADFRMFLSNQSGGPSRGNRPAHR